MAKIKWSSCLIFSFVLCCYSVVVFGSNESESSSNLDPSPLEHLEGLVKYFKALETRNQEQGKVNEELKEQVKLLNQKFDQFESRISEDSGVWLLTPPLRGPPGKDGKKGDKGEKGDSVLPDQQSKSSTSCSAAMEILPSLRSKKQTIYPYGSMSSTSLEVLCDFENDGGGWTVIQNRNSGPREQFDRNWTAYANGFGSLDENFWLGLDNIHALTKNGDQELRIELEDFEGNKRYAKYSSFSVSDASDFYQLSISGFSGDAGNSMRIHNGCKFTTKDKDNDAYSGNCAQWSNGGGWWFPNNCAYSDCVLNGLYREKGEAVPYYQGIIWTQWKGSTTSMAKTEMKIRTRKTLLID